MKRIRLIIPIMFISCFSGCYQVDDLAGTPISKESVEVLVDTEETLSTWSLTYELTNLKQAVKQELVRWQDPETAIPFVIADINLKENEHIGLFRSVDYWELKGKSESGSPFVLENNGGNVILTHGNQQQTYVSDNFQFMLPSQHLHVIDDLLRQPNYEFLSWSKLEKGWSVELRAPIKPIEFVFNDYLKNHFIERNEKINYQFDGFSCLYTIILRESAERLVIKQINFSLIKNEEQVDTLHFIL